jgi:tRNA1(Val) A37 N6-methylase TrmN6
MKVINDLIGYKDMKVVQNTEWFSFSLDSVLLPRFVTINKNTKNILDIGTGNAPIPSILSTRTNANIYGFEIQKDLYKLALETIELNNITEQVKLINDDVKNIGQYFKYGFFDIIVSNPPFFLCMMKLK